jgi:hypothetical protein
LRHSGHALAESLCGQEIRRGAAISVAHPSVVSVIPYHNAPGQVRQNLDWMKYPAPDALWADLRQEGLIRPEAPTLD